MCDVTQISHLAEKGKMESAEASVYLRSCCMGAAHELLIIIIPLNVYGVLGKPPKIDSRNC